MADAVLVAYGTKYGSTAEIAQAVGATLRNAGLGVDVKRAREVRSVAPYRAVVVGSAVYMARWRRDALAVLRRHKRDLAQRDVWVFSSGPVGEQADDDRAEAERWTKPRRVQMLAGEIGVRDHAVFGGRIAEDGGFLRRKMAKDMPAELRDRRNWDAIGAWARSIATQLGHGGAVEEPPAAPGDAGGEPAG